MGQGETLHSLYAKKKFTTVLVISLIGFSITGTSIVIDNYLSLNALYLGGLIFLGTYMVGKILQLSSSNSFEMDDVDVEDEITDKEIRLLLKKRGLKDLVKDNNEE